MTSIDWKSVQTKLSVTSDGIPGKITYGAIYKHLGARSLAEELGSATHSRIGSIAANPNRLANWLGQMAHETGGFRRLTENLTYTTAKGIQKTWPSRFPSIASATSFVRNPEALANKVYGGRLGNTSEGDGWKYRGRGIIQLTGKANYQVYEDRLRMPFVANPDLVKDPIWAVTIAILYWHDKGLNALADKDDRKQITRRINGGQNGLTDRIKRTNVALNLLS